VLVALAAAVSAAIATGDRAGPDPSRRDQAGASETRSRSALRAHLSLLLVAGALGALAFAVENAHQSWSAVYLADTLHAEPMLVGAGPAVFAGFVALTRFAISTLNAHRAWIVFTAGAMTH
jgi:hypothetical protein